MVVLTFAPNVCVMERSHPLNEMTYPFRVTQRSTCLSSTKGVTRSSARARHVNACCAVFTTFVARCRRTVVIITFIGFGNTRMCPDSSTCLLICFGFHGPSVVGSGVFNIACTIKWYLVEGVGDMYSNYQRNECPFNGDLILILLFLSFYKSRSTDAIYREVFPVLMSYFLLNRSSCQNSIPFDFFATCLRVREDIEHVVVRGSFVLLHVPFTEHMSGNTYVFRRQGCVEGGGELDRRVFYYTRRTKTLPTPFIFVIFRVVAITLPSDSVTILWPT